MNSCDNVGWRFIEEAVIRDKGYDEEAILTAVLQSHFIRHGFVNSLKAFTKELRDLEQRGKQHHSVLGASGVCGKADANGGEKDGQLQQGVLECEGNNSGEWDTRNGNDGCATGAECVGSVLEGMQVRKCVQVLCHNEEYEKAAALLPSSNEMKVRLLALEAVKRAKRNQSAAISFLCKQVGPLIYKLPDAVTAHHIFVESLGAVTGVNGSCWEVPSPCAIAREVNESLLDSSEPSALDVLLSWSELQQAARSVEKELHHKSTFPFPVMVSDRS
ncbi:hypothetical protein, conserved [Trypanosoma brucei gambiense DAL972]|uniref:CTLH domain-containing protein n=3 Tax=Trypanosoma brucei TaxID=5691 RepID=Q57UA9_TRYB2|nr:hypothetical protein, conserved [Trypanosoma brucei gambiense DAL972]XP_845027.1 hypothetical protein, conserved [Trypanosoma brucei brucei TREU927]AAX70810.1 hypothetical protein, conserved [Trypanosoma brucei]RHW72300.1 hypothetical protein DPX39_050042200 [Trypanosoma brucei equiperdum]AAZ11468.1 hypothetical protein, conserved [Trypanosoma brucei brucei TREU927]CBH11359.1 hypothetical protein, conserved [Trypanosoma brucei gambiense DAL972]|eukprot:XP_011773646.1 hypothetical protein, conserved [Trypanosoma brucei gambiense DAL972]